MDEVSRAGRGVRNTVIFWSLSPPGSYLQREFSPVPVLEGGSFQTSGKLGAAPAARWL